MNLKKFNLSLIFFLCGLILLGQSSVLPSSLPGLKLWIHADSVKATNFTNIDTCYDLSGNSNHLFQSNTTNSAILLQNQLNGHDVLNFDGINDFFDFAPISNIRTVFWVIKERFGATLKNRGLLGHDSNYDFYRSTTKIWDNQFTHPNILNGITRLNFDSINGQLIDMPTQYSIIDLLTTGNVTANNFSRDRGDNTRVWDGDLAELIIYNQALTPLQVRQIEQYLNDKYAPPIKLPADMVVLNSFCDTTLVPIITNNNQYANYQWSTGASTPTINLNKSGKYWVKATNIFGIVSSDTIMVNFPDYHKPQQNYLCANSNLLWNTDLPQSQYTFQWQDNSTDSIFNINQAGNYYVKITDSFGCSVTSDTVKIIEDNFASSVSLGPDTSLCSGNSITLTNGNSQSLTYSWSNGSINDSLLINTSGQYSVVVTNTNNCTARDTINVTVTGLAPVADFSTSIGCQNTAVSFTNLSSAPSGTITNSNWYFGDAASGTFSTSTVTNPFHTFSDTGNYSVQLIVETNAGCKQAITKNIHISPTPTVNFTIGNSCQNDSTAFTNLSTSPAGYPINSLNWNFGDVLNNTSGLSNPKHLFPNQSNYTIKLVATNSAGCKDSLINIITVKAQVKADFTYSTPCTNTTTVFQDNSIAASLAPSTRQWNFGTVPLLSGLSPTRTYTASGPYLVSLTVTVNGCTSNISKVITVFSPPAPNFTIPAFCAKDTTTALNSSVAQSGIISSNNWKLNNNFFSSAQNPTLSLIAAGTYSVRLTVVNSFGCRDSLTKTITVYPLPNVDFTTNPSTYYYINSPVNFIPSILNASSYVWSGSSISTSTLQSPFYSFNTEGTYTVSLNLKDQLGCRNSKTKTLLVSKPYLDMAILNVITIKDDDGFMTVKTDLANYGTIPVSTFEIQYQISDGGNNKETWTGALNPSSFFTYTFISKSASLPNSTNNITCVDIKKVNGVNDENQTNNTLCSALSFDEISVSNPIPNPAEGDITLPVILNKNIDINITIYNSNGQLLYEAAPQKGIQGLNLILLPTSSFSRGCYIIKTVIDDKVFIKKFIKIASK